MIVLFYDCIYNLYRFPLYEVNRLTTNNWRAARSEYEINWNVYPSLFFFAITLHFPVFRNYLISHFQLISRTYYLNSL